jgi:hypothetical protein
MSEPTLEDRRSKIESLRDMAERFLGQATHATMKDEIREALFDLDQAADSLSQQPIKPSVAVSIDMSITIAVLRLHAIGTALERHGPDAAPARRKP